MTTAMNHNEIAAICRELLEEEGFTDLSRWDSEIYRFAAEFAGRALARKAVREEFRRIYLGVIERTIPIIAREFVNDTRLMTAEGKWTPESVLLWALMKRLAEVTPHPEGMVILSSETRQLELDVPHIPENAALIIQVIGENRVRVTAADPIVIEEEEKEG